MDNLEKKEFAKGAYLVKQGDTQKCFFFIVKGRVAVVAGHSLGELGPQDAIGESVLFTDEPWPFSLVALRKTEVHILDEKRFFSLIQSSPEFLRKLISHAAKQIERVLRGVPFRHEVKRVAFILQEKTDFVPSFLSMLDSPLHMDRPQPIQDEKYRWIIMEAKESDPWKEEIMEEADRVFYIDKNSNKERILRAIEGKSIAVVLGSGGARCAAQIGVLQAMTEAHVPIDAIGGVGLGALIAALFAKGNSPYQISAIIQRLYLNMQSLLDFTFPYLSFVKGKRIEKVLHSLFGDETIENLPIPYFALSSDLATKEEYIHRQGKIKQAVRASFSVPGIFPPVCQEEAYLVDGSITNVLPLDVMRKVVPDSKIVGIDTNSSREWPQPKRFPHYISGWTSLLRTMIPFAKPQVPIILQTLLRATLLDSSLRKKRVLEESPPDLLITPPLGEYPSWDFRSFDRLYKIGYTFAKEHMKEWKVKIE